MSVLRGALGLCLLGAACSPPPNVGVASEAIGEPTSGYPTPDERLGIMALNRARSDPSTLKGPQSTIYPAVKPVLWSLPLSRSSRFHATNLDATGVTLMHESPCTLKTNVATANCDGTVACACASAVPTMCASCANVAATDNGCGTDPFVRIGYFTAGTTVDADGEIAAAGYDDPMATVDGWVDEPAGADGHRTNILDQGGISSNVMGYGRVAGNGCFSAFDVSDSGNDSSVTMPIIPTAAVTPSSGGAGTFTFYATWADPTSGAPASLDVVIDGQCTPMTRELGEEHLNATYKATSSLAAGCHNYYVLGHDAAGKSQLYPTTGALTISVAGTACTPDFVTQAPHASCDGTSTGSTDAAGTSMDLGGPSNASDLAVGGGGGTHDGGPVVVVQKSGGCSIGGQSSAPPLFFGLVLLALALRRRRAAS